MTDRGEHMGKANGSGRGTHDGDDDPSASPYVRVLAELIATVNANHDATIEAVDDIGTKVANVETGVKSLGSHILDLEARIMLEFSKLSKNDSEHRDALKSVTNEVNETRAALSGLQVVGVWLDRNKRWGAVFGFVVVVLLQILHLFK